MNFRPVSLVLARLIISFPLLFLSGVLLKRLKKVSRRDIPIFMILAFFEPFLYFTGESMGMQFVSSTIAAILIATVPLFTSLSAFLFFREKLTFTNYAGMIISFLGVLAVILSDSSAMNATWKGIALMMVAVFSATTYGFLVKRISGRYNSISIVTIQNTIASIYFIPFFFIFDFKYIITKDWTFSMLIPVIYLSVFASTLAYLGFIQGLRVLGVSKATVFTNFIPVFTAVFAFIILGDSINLIKISGIFCVVAGLIMSQLSGKSKDNKQEEIIIDELY